jgi:hypothetical protein
MVSQIGAELGLLVNMGIAVFSLGPHYKDIYFGFLNRAAKSRFGPGEKHFSDPPLRVDLLRILTLNPND